MKTNLKLVKSFELRDSIECVSSDKKLPHHLILEGVHAIHYRIGLSLFAVESVKRHRFHNPYFFFIFALFHTMRCAFAMVLPPEDDRIFFLIGDYPHYMNIGFHYNISYLFCGLIIISLQSIHFFYFWRDIEPSYLKPFQLISGLITGRDIGLTDTNHILSFTKYSKLLLHLTKYYIRFFTAAAGSISLILVVIADLWSDLVLVAIPWVVFHTIAAYIFCLLLSYKLVFFHLICFYLRLKFRQINGTLMSLNDKTYATSKSNVEHLLQSFDSLHLEINEFSKNVWSDFLFVFSGLIIIALTASLYSLLFLDLLLILKIFLGVVDSFFLMTLGFVLIDSSSVSFQAFLSHKILANIFANKSLGNALRLSHKLKVIIFPILTSRVKSSRPWTLWPTKHDGLV